MTPEQDVERMVEKELESLRTEPRLKSELGSAAEFSAVGHDRYQPWEDNGNQLPDRTSMMSGLAGFW